MSTQSLPTQIAPVNGATHTTTVATNGHAQAAAAGAAANGVAASASAAATNAAATNAAATSNSFDIASIPEISIPHRILMGAGPSASYPEALRAMGANTLGHLDPDFVGIMNNVGTMLRAVFRTKNRITGAISGTGTAGMEASLCNLIEAGDEVLICVAGYFSSRMQQMAERMGAQVRVLEREWGTVFTPEEVRHELSQMTRPKLVSIVHAETSTGTLQPLEKIAQIAHEFGACIIADAVTSLAGCPVLVDEWDLDVCFSGTQKCIGSPPGLSPITFSERAMDVIHNRKKPVQSWYLDMSLVENYWGDNGSGGRAYHHTAPSNALFGLHEALRMTLIEGLENRWARHELHSRALMSGLQTLGLQPFAQEGHRLWQLNAVRVPSGIDDLEVRTRLLRRYDTEIGGGLGPVKGQIWRIGTMGYSANQTNILNVLSALEDILDDLKYALPARKSAARDAAEEIYDAHESSTRIVQNGGQGETIGAETVAQGVAHKE